MYDAENTLHSAITNNYLKIAKLLLENGINPDPVDEHLMTPLHTMVVRNNIEAVELLLFFKANPDCALASGETPLWTACRHGFNLIAYKLLLAGANPNLVNTDFWSPLMVATYMKNYELALILLQFNADPNIAKTDDGTTPIFFSMLDNNRKLSMQLLKAGARLDIRNLHGQTPEEFIASYEANKIPEESTKKSLLIEFHKANAPIKEKITKFGGQPVWLEEATWPMSKENGDPMRFICQIKIEKDMFPDAIGEIAYIFMTDVEGEFVEGTYLAEGGENAVIIQQGKLPPFIDVGNSATGPSVEHEFAVTFIAVAEPFQSQQELDEFLESQPEENRAKYMELFSRTKIGGTPLYIQGEELPEGEGWQPLLQINSSEVPFYINFGDVGTAYIYINKEGNEGRMLWQCS